MLHPPHSFHLARDIRCPEAAAARAGYSRAAWSRAGGKTQARDEPLHGLAGLRLSCLLMQKRAQARKQLSDVELVLPEVEVGADRFQLDPSLAGAAKFH